MEPQPASLYAGGLREAQPGRSGKWGARATTGKASSIPRFSSEAVCPMGTQSTWRPGRKGSQFHLDPVPGLEISTPKIRRLEVSVPLPRCNMLPAEGPSSPPSPTLARSKCTRQFPRGACLTQQAPGAGDPLWGWEKSMVIHFSMLQKGHTVLPPRLQDDEDSHLA